MPITPNKTYNIHDILGDIGEVDSHGSRVIDFRQRCKAYFFVADGHGFRECQCEENAVTGGYCTQHDYMAPPKKSSASILNQQPRK